MPHRPFSDEPRARLKSIVSALSLAVWAVAIFAFCLSIQKLIAHSAPALFAGLPALFCKGCNIGVKYFKTKRVLFAEGTHIFLVAPRLLTAQPVVDMGDGQGQRIPLAYFIRKSSIAIESAPPETAAMTAAPGLSILYFPRR